MKPIFDIRFKEQSLDIHNRLISLILTDKREIESDSLTFTISDHDNVMTLPPLGAILSVSLGFNNQGLYNKGRFIVDALEYSGTPNQLTIRAHAADFRHSLNVKNEQSWHEVSLGHILGHMARRYDLKLVSHNALLDTPIKHIDQTGESDAHFLTRLSRLYGATATIKEGRLLFLPKGQGRQFIERTSEDKARHYSERTSNNEEHNAFSQNLPSIAINPAQCSQYRYSQTERETKYQGVRAYYHDIKAGQRKNVLSGQNGYVYHLRGTYDDEQQAHQAAQTQWSHIQRGKLEMNVTLAIGNPHVIPETPTILHDFKQEIDSTSWIVSEVTHTLNDSGYTTTIILEVKG